nr:MAG TPA: hypothetical protein [Caudoviricetes sp.]
MELILKNLLLIAGILRALSLVISLQFMIMNFG